MGKRVLALFARLFAGLLFAGASTTLGAADAKIGT